jgi:hypothetical protein
MGGTPVKKWMQISAAYVNQPKMLVPSEGLNIIAGQPNVTRLNVQVIARRCCGCRTIEFTFTASVLPPEEIVTVFQVGFSVMLSITKII